MPIFEINTKYSRNLWAKLDELQGFFQLDKFILWIPSILVNNLQIRPGESKKNLLVHPGKNEWRRKVVQRQIHMVWTFKTLKREKGSLRGYGMHHFKYYSFKWDVQQMI